MFEKILNNKLYIKYREPLTYIIYSGITAVIEMLIGLLLLNTFISDEVLANTVSVVIGTVIHYFLVTKSTFKSKVTIGSIAVYLITFLLGLGIQNGVVWLGYNVLFVKFPENFRFVVSKAASLVISFAVMFIIRKMLYGWLNRKNAESAK